MGADVDLTDYFMVGTETVPAFGMSTEVTLPWSEEYENALSLEMTIAYEAGETSTTTAATAESSSN